jgi:hypothetical protein
MPAPDGLPSTFVFRGKSYVWQVDVDPYYDDGGYWNGGTAEGFLSSIFRHNGVSGISHYDATTHTVYNFRYTESDGSLAMLPNAQVQVAPYDYVDPGNFPTTFQLGDDLAQFIGSTKPLPAGTPTSMVLYIGSRSWPLTYDGRIDYIDLTRVRFSYLEGLTTAVYIYVGATGSQIQVSIPGLDFYYLVPEPGAYDELLHSVYRTFDGRRLFVRQVGARAPTGDSFEGESLDYVKDHVDPQFETAEVIQIDQ